MISTHLYLFNHALKDRYLFLKKKKKLKHLKFTLKLLNKMNKR
jgi:hypothetical protein